jgi:DNA mismatch repair protein MutL
LLFLMPRIRQLDPTLVNQIAAGEVIERPGSVVKELLENAVDAGATQIDVEVEQGGIELIRVVDDGCGIEPDDLPLALRSHATSKVSSADDLEQIRTLGFRGEALASIGSVASVLLQSRPRDAQQGAQLCCEGGRVGKPDVWNGRPGTRIEVRHLFYNLPVRRKFLKTAGTEMSHVSEAVLRLSLGFPHLGVRLNHNERDVYQVAPNSPLEVRITRFFGDEVGGKLVRVEGQQGPVRLTGLVAEPSVNRGNSRLQYFFVNGRCVRDRTLGHALQEGMHGLLMVGRYAIGFLYLDMPPELVDVNVHPTKAEVRFRDGQGLHHLVRTAVRAALHGRPLQSTFNLPTPSTPATHGHWSLRPTPSTTGPGLFTQRPLPAPSSPSVENRDTPELSRHNSRVEPPLPILVTASPELTEVQATPSPSFLSPNPVPAVAKAMQFHDAYLVVEEGPGMMVIDQHALHERILYEQLRDRLRQGELEVQRLLVPEPVDLPADQFDLAVAHQSDLARIGLEVQPFGGTTLLLSSYPAMLTKCRPATLLRAAVEHLAAAGEPPTAELLLDNLLRLTACHAAIKAGDKLTPAEMDALLAQRHLVADSHHCPHGRPTSLFFSKQDLDRQFERI